MIAMNRNQRITAFVFALVVGASLLQPQSAFASGRNYYSSWSYRPQSTYYYSYYYYKPTSTQKTYSYHYCIYYPSRPRYVYYYNPVRKVYWGRYDLEQKGYSLLAEKDRKEKLDDIPESAFPEPGKMPEIPESKDGERVLRIDPDSLPNVNDPEDAPAK
jgi:hypothetical protein